MRNTRLPNSYWHDNIIDRYITERHYAMSNHRDYAEYYHDNAAVKEILSFLYINKYCDINRDQKLVDYLSNYKYQEGILSGMEELYLVGFRIREAIDYCLYEKILKRDIPFGKAVQDEYALPKEVVSAVVQTADFKETDTIYNPYAGLCSFGIALCNNRVIAEEIDEEMLMLAYVRLAFNDNNVVLRNIDSLNNNDDIQHFNNVIAALPINKSVSEYVQIIYHLYNRLNNNGKLCIVIPTLFLTSQEATGIRKKITDDKSIKNIFVLPNKILSSSLESLSILVIEKKIHDFVEIEVAGEGFAKRTDTDNCEEDAERYFDFDSYVSYKRNRYEDLKDHPQWEGTTDIYKKIEIEEINNSDYNWNPNRYLLSEQKNYIHLNEIVKVLPRVSVEKNSFYLFFEGWGGEHYISSNVTDDVKASYRVVTHNVNDDFIGLVERINTKAFENVESIVLSKNSQGALMKAGHSYIVISDKGKHIGFLENIEQDVCLLSSVYEENYALEVTDKYTVSELSFVLFNNNIREQFKNGGFLANLHSIVVPLLNEKEKEELREKYLPLTNPQNDENYSLDTIVDKYNEGRNDDDDCPDCRIIALELMIKMYSIAVAAIGKSYELVDLASDLGITFKEGILEYKELRYLYRYHYKDVIDECCRMFSVGSYQRNKCRSEFVDYFCSNVPGETVYCPFAGLGFYAIERGKSNLIMEEIDPLTRLAAKIRLDAYDIGTEIECHDSIETLKNSDEKYDYIVTNVPRKCDLNHVIPLLTNKLSDKGRLDMVVPDEFLVSDKYNTVRANLINSNKIGLVVSLPGNCAYISYHNGYAFEQVCMFDAFDYDKGQGKFDASDIVYDSGLIDSWHEDEEDYENYLSVPYKELKRSGLLSPITYSLSKIKKYVKFSDICTLPTIVTWEDIDDNCLCAKTSILTSKMGNKIYELTDTSSFERKKDKNDLEKIVLSHLNFSLVPANTPFIGIIEKKLFFCEGLSEDIAIGKCFIPQKGYTPIQVAYMLEIPEVKEQIREYGLYGNTMNSIFLPDMSEHARNKLVMDNNIEARKKAEAELKRVHNEYEKEIHIRKHAISQNLSAFQSTWNKLNKYRIQHHGLLNDEDVVSVYSNISIADLFNTLDHRLSDVLYQIENFTNDNDWGEPTTIWIDKFIRDYISNSHSTDYTYDYQASASSDVSIKMPYRALRQVFNNIIANAVSHGFADASPNYKVKFTWTIKKGYLHLAIENNGNPIPDTIDVKNVFIYGYSSKLHENGHSGIGGAEIHSIVSKSNGSVEIISTPNEEYKVKYLLSFPLSE